MPKLTPAHGASITLGTTGGTYLCTEIQAPSVDAGEVDITTHSTPRGGQAESMPGDVLTIGEGSCTFLDEGDNIPFTAAGTVEIITITAAAAIDGGTPKAWAGSAYIKSITPGSYSANSTAVATWTMTFKWMGKGLNGSGLANAGTDLTYTS